MHLVALAVWVGAGVLGGVRASAARRRGETTPGLDRLTSALRAWTVEHGAFALLVAAGLFLMVHRGWGLGHARWLGVKVGLVAFLFLPLQAMHAYVCHVWVARGLAQTTVAPPYAKDLVRGLGMEEMIRTLETVLFGAAVPLVVWLSVCRTL